MNCTEFVNLAAKSSMTERQAEAFWRRHIEGQSRQKAASELDTTPSNIDNLERAAREKLRHAENLIALVRGVGYDDLLSIGVCADCDEPTDSLRPRPGQDDVPMDDWIMICPDCHPSDTENIAE